MNKFKYFFFNYLSYYFYKNYKGLKKKLINTKQLNNKFYFYFFKQYNNLSYYLYNFYLNETYDYIFLGWTKEKKIINILIKKTKSNYFLTLIDEKNSKTIFKISGGYAYKIGAEINKKKSNKKKQKYKTTIIVEKKQKEFKKTSYYALQYLFSKSIYKIIELNYEKINLILLNKINSYIFNSIYHQILKKYTKKFLLNDIILNPKISHNGMRKKKLRRL